MDPTLAGILSELMINLAAAWITTVFIVPQFTPRPRWFKFIYWLLSNILFAIFSLIIAFELRKNL